MYTVPMEMRTMTTASETTTPSAASRSASSTAPDLDLARPQRSIAARLARAISERSLVLVSFSSFATRAMFQKCDRSKTTSSDVAT